MTPRTIAWRSALTAILIGLLVLALTPAGVWLAGVVATSVAADHGWELDIGDHGGTLVFAADLQSVHLRLPEKGIEVDIARVSLAPWSWQVDLQQPNIRWSRTDSEAAAAGGARDTLRLPLENLPAVEVMDGAFVLGARGDSLQLDLKAIDASLTPDHGEATLDLSLGEWTVSAGDDTITGEARSSWRLQATAIDLQEAFVRVATAAMHGTVRGQASLDLTPGLDLSAAFTGEGAASDLEDLWLDLSVDGALAPLTLRGSVAGAATHTTAGPLALQAAGGVVSAAVSVDSFDVEIAGGRVSGQALWRADSGINARGRITGVGLQSFTSKALRGTVDGHVQLRGSPDNPDIEADLQSQAIAGIAADPVDLALHLDLQDERLAFQAVSEHIGRLDGSGHFALAPVGYALDLTGNLDAEAWLGLSWPLVVQGSLRADTLEATLTAPDLPFGERPPGPVRIDGSLTAWRFLDLQLGVDEDQVLAHTRLDLATAHLDTLNGTTRGLPLADLSPWVSGQLQGRIAARGALKGGTKAGLSVRVDDFGVAGWNIGPTTLVARLDAGKASIVAGAEGLEIHAEVDTGGTARFVADLRNVTAHRATFGDSIVATGQIHGAATWRRWTEGELSVEVDSAHAVLSGWSLGLPDGVDGEYADGHIRWRPTEVHTPLGRLQLRGDLTADSLLLAATIDSVDLSGLEQVRARGEVSLHVGGSLDDPQARLDVGLRSVELSGRPLGDLTASLDLRDSLRGSLQISTAGSDQAGMALTLSSPRDDFIPRGRPIGNEEAHIRPTTQDLDASTLATYAFGDSTALTASLSADLRLPACQLLQGIRWRDLTGYVELQELTLHRDRVRLRLAEPSRAQLSRDQAELKGFDLPVEVFQRDTDAFEAAGSVHINGRLVGDGGGLRVRVEDLDLLVLEKAIPGRVSLPTGELSLQANLTGTFEALALDASARVALDLLGEVSARAFGRPRAWNGSVTWVTPVEDSLLVTATAPAINIWPKWDELTMRARSEGIELLPLLDQVPQLETLIGTVRLDVTADSLSTNPRFAGQVEVEDLQLALLDVKPGYSFPAGRIEFGAEEGARAHAELSGFTGRTMNGDGTLQLSGFFDLLPEGGTDYRLALSGQDIPYAYEDVFEAPDIDMELVLRPEERGPLLEGDVTLSLPKADVQLVDLTAPPVPPPPTVPNVWLENTHLNVYVDIDGLESRSELSNITLEGQARVYGTFYQPRFQGELEIVDGQVIILNRAFDFTRGRIILDRLVPTYSILDLMYDPILLDPELDLEATVTVQPHDPNEPEAEVTMVLDGPASTAAPRLTSPGLGDGEVLNLLAFGQTTRDSGTGYGDALATAAGQLLLARRVQRVGLDEFLLMPSGTTLGTAGESSVRVGKFLSWPVPMWVRYEARTREAGNGQFEVEYHILPWMTIDASAYSEYQLYGLGVGLKREF